jgi:DNA-binding transcriptional LysR family regulator
MMINKYIALQKVVECRNMGKAAEALGYSQSAMSQMISSLEDELSIKLLHRSKHGTELTAEGKELYPFIEEAIYRYRALLEKAAEIRGLETGIIRMGTLASISANWLPPLIHEFEVRYPSIEFVIHQGDYTSIQDWIKTGAIDFGFVSPDAVNGMELTVLNQGEFKAILPENHPLAKETSVSLSALAKEPFILLEEGHFYEPLEAFRNAGAMPQIKYTIHDDYAIMAMVEEGLGVSILADLILRRTNYKIKALPLDPPIFRTMAIGYLKKEALPAASKRFIELLKAKADTLSDSSTC